MHLTVLVLFTATGVLAGVSGHGFPPAISHLRTKSTDLSLSRSKRHDTEQCVNDKLDTAFSGDDPYFVSNCRNSARGLIYLDDTSDSQLTINTMFSTFCDPKCGNVIIDAFSDCEHFEEAGVHNLKDFLIGLCGTNQNGDICYQIHGEADTQLNSERTCYYNYNNYYYNSGQCVSGCRNTLLEGVKKQGCCLNTYQNFVTNTYAGSDYSYTKAGVLYDACNVDLPTGCNNSPITAGSGVMPQVALVTLISVLIFSVLLG